MAFAKLGDFPKFRRERYVEPRLCVQAARRPAPRRRPQSPPIFPAVILAIGVLILLYEVWYASVRIKGPYTPDRPNRHGRYSRRQLDGDIGLGRRGGGGGRQFPADHLRNLVLVACHSVYTGLDFRNSEEQSSWFLLEYQKVPGQTHSFVQHIQLGVQEAAADPSALLLFSGGKTRKEAGPRAEGEGYWMVAEAAGWYGHKEVRDRTFTEDHARDSFENLLFGLCRFYELTGRYPESIVVVGYEFKRERFMQLHRAAVHFPLEHFSYVGTPALNKGALQGEAKTVASFRADPYGCSAELVTKRMERDPFSHGGLTPERCPDMGELLDYCGPEAYQGQLPWGSGEVWRGEGEQQQQQQQREEDKGGGK